MKAEFVENSGKETSRSKKKFSVSSIFSKISKINRKAKNSINNDDDVMSNISSPSLLASTSSCSSLSQKIHCEDATTTNRCGRRQSERIQPLPSVMETARNGSYDRRSLPPSVLESVIAVSQMPLAIPQKFEEPLSTEHVLHDKSKDSTTVGGTTTVVVGDDEDTRKSGGKKILKSCKQLTIGTV